MQTISATTTRPFVLMSTELVQVDVKEMLAGRPNPNRLAVETGSQVQVRTTTNGAGRVAYRVQVERDGRTFESVAMEARVLERKISY